jgi:RNA polymerase sigma factor for flagellar operon FliA
MIDLKPEHNIGDLQAEVEHKDLLNRLKRAITSLPQSYQTVVNLYYFEGKTFKEIGQLTNRSANCSCKILKRAIKKLKLILN